MQENWTEEVLSKSLEEICLEKHYQEKCLLMLVHALQSYDDSITDEKMKIQDYRSSLTSKYQLMVSSILLTTVPMHFPGALSLGKNCKHLLLMYVFISIINIDVKSYMHV